WGEVGVAVCVARPGTAVEEGELIAWLSADVARYKLPRRVFFWDSLPKSGYGKVTKRVIREGLEERGDLPLDGRTVRQSR
ncbi:MAG: acyl-CoA synthetase, partial [Methylobacterium organophilum]|nr:acyl-CoA synthetase [Methylobacterium organophilum]